MKANILRLLLLCIFCAAACFSTGYGFSYWAGSGDILIGTFGSALLFAVCAFRFPKTASVLLLVYVLTTALYFPVGWLYGAPTFKIIGSALEADPREAGEFFTSLPLKVGLMQAAFLLFGAAVWYALKPVWPRVKYWPSAAKRHLTVLLFALLFLPPLLNFAFHDGDWQEDAVAVPLTAVGFYSDLALSPYIYWHKKRALTAQTRRPSTWTIGSVSPRYRNYVLVIGESARSDYMHAYGFPLPNTPFLSRTKGLLLDGYLSAAELTIFSLQRTLALPNAAHNNLVSLAKQAGFETVWLSNQGMLGLSENTVSGFAVRSDRTYFTRRGDHRESQSVSDNLLLPQLAHTLAQPTDKPRLIVMHLMGSHSDFCRRLDKGATQLRFQNEKLSCYVNSIAQTDRLLEEAVGMLQGTGEPYSLIYFSDHGLKHTGRGQDKTLVHGGDTRQSFTVPFAKISSDDTEHKVIKVRRSAFGFLKGFAQWTGIRAAELPQDYDFFGDTPDMPSPDNNLQKIEALPSDPISGLPEQ